LRLGAGRPPFPLADFTAGIELHASSSSADVSSKPAVRRVPAIGAMSMKYMISTSETTGFLQPVALSANIRPWSDTKLSALR
jgi:hypothetical protein